MPDVILKPAYPTANDVTMVAAVFGSLSVWLAPVGIGNDVSLSAARTYPVVSSGGAAFPTQYDGLRAYYGGSVKSLCLVAEADAPSGMGGVWKIRKGGTMYAAYLVETNDANATPVRVRTSTGTKAVRLKT